MTVTYTSRVRAIDAPADSYAPCCGQQPRAITWPRGMGKGLISVMCRNPECPNHTGVLADTSDVHQKWAQWRRDTTAD